MPATAVRGQKLANELARMADRLEGKFRQAFLRSMLAIADEPELKALIKEIQAGRFVYGDPIDMRLNSIRIDLSEMNEVARQAIAGSAKITKDVMNLKGSFDVVNDAVIEAARNLSVDLSTYLRKSTKESLRQTIEDLISGDISEAEAVRRIKMEVGLLPKHAKAVSNYRKTLISSGTPRGKANQLAEQYAKRLLKYRADMIARTEVARATGIGQTQFWRQMRDQGALPTQANRVWITALDERACDFCRSMNGQVATIDGGWDTPNGYMEYPQASHPHCRCSSGITMSRTTKTGRMGAIAKLEELEFDQWISKHLSGKHDQKNHGRGGSMAEMSVSSDKGASKPAKPKSQGSSRKKKDTPVLGVDYDEYGYPIDNHDGIVGQQLLNIHGLYDEPMAEAMAIAKRGPKSLLKKRDVDGLPSMLKLKEAEKRYGDIPEQVVKYIKDNFGVDVRVVGRRSGEEEHGKMMDTLHGVAQAVEELTMSGIPVKDMLGSVDIVMSRSQDVHTRREKSVLGYFEWQSEKIAVVGDNMLTATEGKAWGMRNDEQTFSRNNFNADALFYGRGFEHGEATVRRAYATMIHEVGHAMDNYVGKQIMETRVKLTEKLFEGTNILAPDWKSKMQRTGGIFAEYSYHQRAATGYYSDLGVLNDYGTVTLHTGNSPSIYGTRNIRENFAENFTAFWLYGASKGRIRTDYYNQYIARIGNIVEMSQGIIKVENGSGATILDFNELPPTHPIYVWFTGIVPIA